MAYQKLQVSRALVVIPSDTVDIPFPGALMISSTTTGASALKLIDSAGDFINKGVSLKGGLTIFNFGILTSYIPVLFLQHGVNIIYRTNISYYTDLEPYNNIKNLRKIVNKIMCKYSKNSIKHNLYKSLSIMLDLNGKIIIYKKPQYPNINHIIKNLEKDISLIVGTTAKDFYRIDEKWEHTFALVPYQAKYWIQDPYHLRGYSEYTSWSKYLNHSKKYDWNSWSDELIEVFN